MKQYPDITKMLYGTRGGKPPLSLLEEVYLYPLKPKDMLIDEQHIMELKMEALKRKMEEETEKKIEQGNKLHNDLQSVDMGVKMSKCIMPSYPLLDYGTWFPKGILDYYIGVDSTYKSNKKLLLCQ